MAIAPSSKTFNSKHKNTKIHKYTQTSPKTRSGKIHGWLHSKVRSRYVRSGVWDHKTRRDAFTRCPAKSNIKRREQPVNFHQQKKNKVKIVKETSRPSLLSKRPKKEKLKKPMS
jgi:hypothetical protein